MKERPAKSVGVRERERRAAAVISKSKATPRGLKFVSYRKLSAAERAHGKTLAERAAALLAAKSLKVAHR